MTAVTICSDLGYSSYLVILDYVCLQLALQVQHYVLLTHYWSRIFAEIDACGWSKINSLISLTLYGLLQSVVILDTLVKFSPALWVLFSLSISESITKIIYLSLGWSNNHIVWLRTIFWKANIFWDPIIYVAQTIRERIFIKFTEKCFFPQDLTMHHILKFYICNMPRIGTKMWITTIISCIMKLWSILSANNFTQWC